MSTYKTYPCSACVPTTYWVYLSIRSIPVSGACVLTEPIAPPPGVPVSVPGGGPRPVPDVVVPFFTDSTRAVLEVYGPVKVGVRPPVPPAVYLLVSVPIPTVTYVALDGVI